MKIAVFHNLPSGGAKRALYEFCRELSTRGHIVDAFLPQTANEKFSPLDEVVNQKKVYKCKVPGRFRINIKGLSPFLNIADYHAVLRDQERCQREIAEDINSGGYDVAFVQICFFSHAPFLLKHLMIPSVYYCGEPLRGAYEHPPTDIEDRDGGRVPFVKKVWRQGYGFWWNRLMEKKKRVDAENVRYTTRILVNSYYSRESVLRAYGLNSYVCYLGIDIEKFRPKVGIPKEHMVLSVGGIHAYKGFRFLLGALARITSSVRPKLVVIGDRGDELEKKFLCDLAARSGVEIEVKLDIADEELVDYYNRAAVVAYAPYLEPFGFVSLEAMACGTPVVAVKEGGVRESVVEGVTGFLVDRDEEQFAEAVEYLIRNPQEARQMGERGIEIARSRWTWDKATERLLRNFWAAIAKDDLGRGGLSVRSGK